MPFDYQKYAAVAVAVLLGMIGAAQLAGVASLGLPGTVAPWLGIVAAGLGILQGFLPRVTVSHADPDPPQPAAHG